MAVRSEAADGATRPKGRANNLRWGMALLCFVGLSVNYIDRSALSVALPSMNDDLGFDPSVQGLILGTFFLAYAGFQLPAGVLIDRIGAKRSFALGALVWGVATMLTGLVTGLLALLVFRFLLGIGESTGYPGSAKVVSRWFPRQERAFANSIWDNGARAGTAIALPVVTAIIAWEGWRAAFLVVGVLALLWAVWWWRAYHEPEDHPRVTEQELAYIRAGGAREESTSDSGAKVRWRDLFRYRTVWAMMLGFFCLNYIIFFFITWFPSYLVQARGFDLLELGTVGAVPGVVAIGGSLLGGWVSDSLVRRGWSLTKARKTCLIPGMLLSSVIALAVVVPNAAMAVVLLSVSYASLAFSAASVASLPADVAPQPGQVSSLAGIQNCASNIAGFIGPIVTGVLQTATGGSFVAPLVLSGALGLIGAFSYGVLIRKVEPLPVRVAAE
ncbi:MFS transporter [Saccharopolyspora gloriosae]|uniref:ACS family glucarate transporter-like MFS transporter n=1 Tax=Saccharopolyspora gloriosae TaxID=455344 RepID=A0A840NB31_9PSEU|nr:MFS transporter [Saccharopolyspora gloriosae]MBB5069476.1 ACS family glucarate transporter-like MFS transporter [Saccharopolyspora gloriosae]